VVGEGRPKPKGEEVEEDKVDEGAEVVEAAGVAEGEDVVVKLRMLEGGYLLKTGQLCQNMIRRPLGMNAPNMQPSEN